MLKNEREVRSWLQNVKMRFSILIVDIFTKTHEPVGSKALQDVIQSSSATIRNDMAALEKQGLLEKAHTSSGRMPSRAGFQYFVQNSLESRVD